MTPTALLFTFVVWALTTTSKFFLPIAGLRYALAALHRLPSLRFICDLDMPVISSVKQPDQPW